MINTIIINKIHLLFVNTLSLTEIDSIKLKYMLEIIINDVLKLVMMFALFNLLGYAIPFVYCLIALFLIRTFTGGFHINTFWGCLVFSSSFFLICIYFANCVPLTFPLFIVLGIFISFTMVFISPIAPPQRPVYSQRKILKSKLIGLMIVLIHFIMYLAINKNPYIIQSIWVLFFQSIQLQIAYGGIKYEQIKNTTKTNM